MCNVMSDIFIGFYSDSLPSCLSPSKVCYIWVLLKCFINDNSIHIDQHRLLTVRLRQTL
jgi:hypothetical protein